MKYLVLVFLFLLISCTSQDTVCKENIEERSELDNVVSRIIDENEKNYPFLSENFGILENCKIKIENKSFWANKMPMMDQKDPNNNVIRIMASLSFDNSQKEGLDIFKSVYLKINNKLILLKDNINFHIDKENKNINFNYNLNYKGSLKEKVALVFFLKSKNDSLLLKSKAISINIAY